MSERPTSDTITICTFLILYSGITFFDFLIPNNEDDESSQQESNDKQQQEQQLQEHIDACQHTLSEIVKLLINADYRSINNYLDKEEYIKNGGMISFNGILSLIAKLEIEANTTTTKTPYLSNKIKSIIKLSCESIDTLIDLFESFREALGTSGSGNGTSSVVDPGSLIGIYVRTYCLGFDELPFEYIGRVWNSLREYVYYNDQTRITTSTVVQNNIIGQRQDGGWSSDNEEEKFLPLKQQQANNQKGSNSEQQQQPVSQYYYNFLNNLSRKERIGALDNLHRYFDYAMIRERQQASTTSATNNNNNQMNNNIRMPYVSILLADLHYHCGESIFSIQATEEAIRVAHQSNDQKSIAYALTWLHHNNNNNTEEEGCQPNYNSEELLRRCAERALDYNLVSLYSGALLSLTKYYALGNDGSLSSSSRTGCFDPALLWDTLSAASTRSFRGAIIKSQGRNSNSNAVAAALVKSSNNEGYATQITHCTNSTQSMTLLAKQHLVSSSIWEMIGHAPLSSLSAATALHYSHVVQQRQQALSTQDFAIAIQKIVFSAFYGSCSDLIPSTSLRSSDATFNFHGMSTITPSTNNIMSTTKYDIKRSKRRQTTSTIASNTTIFQTALTQLQCLKRKYNSNSKSHSSDDIWLHSITLLLHQWSLYRGECHNAYAATFLLQSFPLLNNNTTNQSNTEVQIQSIRSLALNYIYSKSWEKAISLTTKLCTISKNAGLHPYYAQFLLQLACIHVQSSPRNAIASLPILLQCISICQQYSMDSLHASALFVMSKIHLLSNNNDKALTLLKAAMPTLLQHSSIEVQGNAWLTLSKCYMAKNATTTKKNISKKLYSLVLNHIQQAVYLFQKNHDFVALRESYYLQAQIYHNLSTATTNATTILLSKRNFAANKFQEINVLLKENNGRMSSNGKTSYFDVLLPLYDSNYFTKLCLR